MKKVLLVKAHVSAYTRKDGVFVAEHEDKRASAKKDNSGPHGLPAGFKVWKGRRPMVDTWQDHERYYVQDSSGKYYGAGLDEETAVSMARKKLDGENAQQKPEVSKERKAKPPVETVRLYHGSTESRIQEIHDGGPFRGLFAAAEKRAAMSHGSGHLHVMDIRSDKIATRQDMRNLSGKRLTAANKVIREHARKDKLSAADLQLMRDAVLDEAEVHDMDEADAARIQDLLGTTDGLAEASWKIQMIRGQVARALGYHAVEMTDEHGVSHLVLPGVKVQRADDLQKSMPALPRILLSKAFR